MRTITLIILHCSATREDKRFTFDQCRMDHIRHRGWKDIGYHYYIERDGRIYPGRSEAAVGAHCQNHNSHSIGICYEGGLNTLGQPADTRTEAQKTALTALLKNLHQRYPRALIVGHHTLNPQKQCPCFDTQEYSSLLPAYSC